MFLPGSAGNQVLVRRGEDKGKVEEEIVHEALEGLGSIAQFKWHKEILEKHEGI
jgi:hypothetical protein